MKWIPVSEGPPKDNTVDYDVTIEDMSGWRIVCRAEFHPVDIDPGWEQPAYWRLTGYEMDIPFKVIAWRIAPMPYKGEG